MSQKRFERKSKQRLSPFTYCIVVEGIKTEKNYFNDYKVEFDAHQRQLQQQARNNGKLQTRDCFLIVKPAGGRSFENVAKMALDQLDLGHQKVWCVVDADFYVRLTGAELQKAKAIHQRAANAGVDFVFSRPCFEVWFRNHFNADASAWIDGDTSKQNIQKLWPDYELKPNSHWALLKTRLESALLNAKIVRQKHSIPPNAVKDCDACSEVDRLLSELKETNPNE